MKKIIKLFAIIITIFIIINIININISYAAKEYVPPREGSELPLPPRDTSTEKGKGKGTGSEKHEGASESAIKVNPDDYEITAPTTDDAVEIVEKVGIVLGAIRNISVVVSVIALMIIGFKYMIGSVQEKANYKATMIPYIIGCIMAVSGTTIVSFIYNAIH